MTHPSGAIASMDEIKALLEQAKEKPVKIWAISPISPGPGLKMGEIGLRSEIYNEGSNQLLVCEAGEVFNLTYRVESISPVGGLDAIPIFTNYWLAYAFALRKRAKAKES